LWDIAVAKLQCLRPNWARLRVTGLTSQTSLSGLLCSDSGCWQSAPHLRERFIPWGMLRTPSSQQTEPEMLSFEGRVPNDHLVGSSRRWPIYPSFVNRFRLD
jgi:hypothetical protein